MKKVKIWLSKIIMIVGFIIGFLFIYKGIITWTSFDNDKLDVEKNKLIERKNELIENGIVYDSFTNYEDNEAYELKVITEVLDPSFSYCSFDEYKNNDVTKNYCEIVNSKDFIYIVPKIVIGLIIIIFSFVISNIIRSFYMVNDVINNSRDVFDTIKKVQDENKDYVYEVIKCPNCGNPLNDVSVQKCPYCNSTIVKKVKK